MSDIVELKVLEHLSSTIHDINVGLEPDVIASWFNIIANHARQIAPSHLESSISVEQDPLLWMKFKISCSKRAVPYVMEAIESNLLGMPFATRLYFQKVAELIIQEAERNPFNVSENSQ